MTLDLKAIRARAEYDQQIEWKDAIDTAMMHSSAQDVLNLLAELEKAHTETNRYRSGNVQLIQKIRQLTYQRYPVVAKAKAWDELYAAAPEFDYDAVDRYDLDRLLDNHQASTDE